MHLASTLYIPSIRIEHFKMMAMPGDEDSVSSSDEWESSGNGDSESSALMGKASVASNPEQKAVERIIRAETRYVLFWREIVTGMLVITASLVTMTTFILFLREDSSEFKSQVRCSVS